MQKDFRYAVGLLLVQLLAWCGCSPQKDLASRLKGADRVFFASNGFFKGPTRLLAITNCVQVFWIGKTPYRDTTGVLEELTTRRRQEYDARRSRSP